jgi:UDP-N-acetylmuramyl tripeptide synthase
MSVSLSVIPGKIIRGLTRFFHSGGSALPGLVIEKIDPGFLARTLNSLPYGVALISGTNGKTTTTKIVVELLESQGLKVFTNRSGSNFTRGVISELIRDCNLLGQIDADIAVVELDEAYAVHFARAVPPRHTLLLNVLRDQLDRFGEIDYTASLLEKVAAATTGKVVVNREDPRLLAIAEQLDENSVSYYGLSTELTKYFPNDEELHGKRIVVDQKPTASVLLDQLKGKTITYKIARETITNDLKLNGIYNTYNAVAAIALCEAVLGDQLDIKKLDKRLAKIKPAFGRGEIVKIGKYPLEIVLVKNPSGFQLGLDSYDNSGYEIMIAINDNYADGRDVSWLYDVDFSKLGKTIAYTSGARAYDMALRLDYAGVSVEKVEPDISRCLAQILKKPAPRRIYCTYTAMLKIRHDLAKHVKILEAL